jgi:hypothetical protein
MSFLRPRTFLFVSGRSPDVQWHALAWEDMRGEEHLDLNANG